MQREQVSPGRHPKRSRIYSAVCSRCGVGSITAGSEGRRFAENHHSAGTAARSAAASDLQQRRNPILRKAAVFYNTGRVVQQSWRSLREAQPADSVSGRGRGQRSSELHPAIHGQVTLLSALSGAARAGRRGGVIVEPASEAAEFPLLPPRQSPAAR